MIFLYEFILICLLLSFIHSFSLSPLSPHGRCQQPTLPSVGTGGSPLSLLFASWKRKRLTKVEDRWESCPLMSTKSIQAATEAIDTTVLMHYLLVI